MGAHKGVIMRGFGLVVAAGLISSSGSPAIAHSYARENAENVAQDASRQRTNLDVPALLASARGA
ncbi:MAG TPA: hypothetical protein VGD02_10670, partial [Gemmatimonadaceae bacterium]